MTHEAFSYIARGWHVHPIHSMRDGACSCGVACSSPGKHPRTPNGFKDATTDPAILQGWLDQWPDMNIGIATGPSNLLVLDVDPAHGGHTSLEALLKRVGDGIMESVRVKTGGNGLHVYYHGHAGIGNSAGSLGLGLDTRGAGGYVLAPPSNHKSDGTYEWTTGRSPAQCALLPLPPALQAELQKPRAAPVVDTPISNLVKGGRNQALTQMAGSMQRRGFTTEAITVALWAHNQAACQPPLGKQEVDAIARSVSRYPKGPAPDALVEAPLSDIGNGRRLVAGFGDVFRYVHEWGWILWEGRHWERDTSGGMEDYAKKTVFLTQAAADKVTDDERKKRLLKFADKSQSRNSITNMLAMARSEPGVDKHVDEFDDHDGLLNVKNCIIDLATGKTQPHSPELYLTAFVDIEYDPNAKCPRWEQFLRECCLGDEQLMTYLQRCVGYTLTGYTDAEVLFFLFGDGENGKSKFIETIRLLLGDLSGALGFDALLSSRDSKPQNALSGMRGKRMATAVEASEGRSLDEAVIKQIVGGDTISVRQMYKDAFDMRPKFKLWMASNYKPAIRGMDKGIWRRIHLIPFQNNLKPGQRDDRLSDKLRAELPGILAWAVRGAMEHHRLGGGNKGLAPPKKVLEAVEEYKEEQNTLGRFIEERCTLRADLKTPAGDLLKAINEWLVDMHEREMTQTALGRRLKDVQAGILKKGRDAENRVVWLGIGLGRDLPLPAQEGLDKFPAAEAQPQTSSNIMPERQQVVLNTIRELSKADPKGYCTDTLLEQTLALKGFQVPEVRDIARRLLDRGYIYMRQGHGTYAAVT